MYLTRTGNPCLVVSVMNVEKFPCIVSSHPWEARNDLSCSLVITYHTVSCLVELNVKALPCLRCGCKIIIIEKWDCEGVTNLARCKCKNGHAGDEWLDSKHEAVEAWNTYKNR